jgi:5-methylcytosine-specific restriction endonuclease McrA
MKLATIDPFDEQLIHDWRSQCDLFRDERWRQQEEVKQRERQARYAEYTAYLESDAWKKKRALVLDRAGGFCEGCGVNIPVQVHHLTYEHLFDEFLWELKAVCMRCHHKAHPDKDWQQ